jgi:polyisoprenoid-binding protein YceI
MLGADVLDAQHHPSIAVAAVSLRGPRWGPAVLARVTLRGVARSLSFPAAVFEENDRLVVIASFDMRQSDFGIEPYSVLGGGLRVRDTIHVRIRVVAQRRG